MWELFVFLLLGVMGGVSVRLEWEYEFVLEWFLLWEDDGRFDLRIECRGGLILFFFVKSIFVVVLKLGLLGKLVFFVGMDFFVDFNGEGEWVKNIINFVVFWFFFGCLLLFDILELWSKFDCVWELGVCVIVGCGVVCWFKWCEFMVGDKGVEFVNELGRGREFVFVVGRSELEDWWDIDFLFFDFLLSMKVSVLVVLMFWFVVCLVGILFL